MMQKSRRRRSQRSRGHRRHMFDKHGTSAGSSISTLLQRTGRRQGLRQTKQLQMAQLSLPLMDLCCCQRTVRSSERVGHLQLPNTGKNLMNFTVLLQRILTFIMLESGISLCSRRMSQRSIRWSNGFEHSSPSTEDRSAGYQPSVKTY